MADAAVPTDGGERTVDVLIRSARRARAARAGGTLTALAAVLALGGCADGRPRAGSPGDVPALLESLAPLLLGGEGGPRPEAPSWPRDLRFHPGARAESIELMAVLHDEGGAPFALRRRLDRLSLRPPAARGAAPATGFAFDDVVRLGGTLASEGDAGERRVRRRDALERVALGLARVSIDAIGVHDLSLSRARGDGGGRCASTLVLEEGDGTRLRLRGGRCPRAGRVAGVVTSDSATLRVEGLLGTGGGSRAVDGIGWARRLWGDPPEPGGALVLERLVLELDGLGQLEVERSRRASGRGPVTVTARLRGAADGAGAERALELEWLDTGPGDGHDGTAGALAEGSVGERPAWTLRAPTAGLDVRLEPLIGEDGGEGARALERTRQLAVRAVGSHAGVGFADYLPRGPASAADGATR